MLALLLLAFGIVSGESRSQPDEKQPKASLSVEEQDSELSKLCEIFGSVDKLPAKGARWVEIQAHSGERATSISGWLVRESDSEIHVLTENGWKGGIDKKQYAAKMRDADFAEFCQNLLAEKKKPFAADPNEIGAYQRERANVDAAVVNAARLAAWASTVGNEDLARQLVRRALDKLRERRSYSGLPARRKLHEFVAGETSPHSEEGDSWNGQDPKVVRIKSLNWNRALAKVPYRPDHDAILARIRQLESLIAEDKAWKEPSKEELVEMNIKQKATYWLHHLRDLDVIQTTQPGRCMVLIDPPRKGTPNSAVELMKLGHEILPQIIAHLDDDRPTRCIGYWRFYAPEGFYTLTYGDCCQQIFEGIALHTIYDRASTSGYPIRDGQGKQCKKRAENWWQEFQTKGEKQVLIEATRRGNRDSYLNAERLVPKFPEVAFEPLRDGIRAAKEGWIRSSMLNYMRQLKDDRVVEFLREQAKAEK